MKIKVDGDALRILYDFLKYARLYPEKMSGVMNYDNREFIKRVRQLEKAYENAKQDGNVDGLNV